MTPIATEGAADAALLAPSDNKKNLNYPEIVTVSETNERVEATVAVRQD